MGMQKLITRYHHPPKIFSVSGQDPSRDWWKYLGAKSEQEIILTASGADRLVLAISSLHRTGNIIVPAYSCERVVSAILKCGDKPELVDIDPSTGSFCRKGVLRTLAKTTKAIILTHLFGFDQEREWLLDIADRQGVPVIEDSALLLETKEKSKRPSYATVLSFGRGKPIALGGGGAVISEEKHISDMTKTSSSCKSGSSLTPRKIKRQLFLQKHTALYASWLYTLYRGNIPLEPSGIPKLEKENLTRSASAFLKKKLSTVDFETANAQFNRAIKNYKAAFQDANIAIAGDFCARLRPGLILPAIAVLSNRRNKILNSMQKAKIDCPRFWNYTLATKLSQSGFSGADLLAKSVLFLPTHADIDGAAAARIAEQLKPADCQAFS